MTRDIDIWITDGSGGKVHIEKETITSLADAVRLLKIGWTAMDDLSSSGTREDGSHSEP